MKYLKVITCLVLTQSNVAFAGRFTNKIDRRVDEKISSFLDAKTSVNILILAGTVTNGFPSTPGWAEGIRTGVVNSTTSRLLRKFSDKENFSLVDRSSIYEVLTEMKFQTTGAVSASDARKIGNLSGATHLLVIELNRFQERQGLLDHITQKLIEVETGRVVAVSIDTVDEKGRVLKKKRY